MCITAWATTTDTTAMTTRAKACLNPSATLPSPIFPATMPMNQLSTTETVRSMSMADLLIVGGGGAKLLEEPKLMGVEMKYTMMNVVTTTIIEEK